MNDKKSLSKYLKSQETQYQYHKESKEKMM